MGRGRPSPSRPGLESPTLPPATLEVRAGLEGRCDSRDIATWPEPRAGGRQKLTPLREFAPGEPPGLAPPEYAAPGKDP
jgi:hypothetical protein